MKTFHCVFLIFASAIFFTLSSCQSDPCDTAVCMNGGVCIDGSCDCPDRYTGASCNEQAIPDRVRISSIVALRFPGMNGTNQWDAEDGADIYFRLYDLDAPLAQPVVPGENANPEQEYNFFINVIDMHNPTNEHTMQLYDFDPETEDELMGEIKFLPYYSTNSFPQTMVLDDGGPVAFRLTFEYIYIISPP